MAQHASRTRASVVCAVDLVCVTTRDGNVAVLLQTLARARYRLPGVAWDGTTPLPRVATNLFKVTTGRSATWCEEVGAHTRGAHPDRAAVSITFVAGVPRGVEVPVGLRWHDVARVPAGLTARHRTAVTATASYLRERANHTPVAFSLLPALFTLGELQQTYEALLGRPVYAASFRRTLMSAGVIAPSTEWLTERRGRPARLFRYLPSTPRAQARGIRLS